jgi:hypothetical protein
MTSLANLIMHLGGEEIPYADRAEEEALLLFSSSTAPKLMFADVSG